MTEDVFNLVGTTQGGSFHVERVVAEGGFSVIYRARHGAFRAPVALKCLKVPDDLTLTQREDFLERFREEAELLFRLSARIPEVVRPLHVDVITSRDGRFVPFLALEWLEGQSLADMITSRTTSGAAPMGLVKLVKLLAPVARALARAHRFPGPAGRVAIVHCDLKPENVFIARVEGREVARILDYGIAMAMRSAGRKVTGPAKPGEFAEPAFFTPGYAAPEQWTPRRYGPTGPRTDVWGLALTLVEAITGVPPLGDDESRMKAAALDEARRPTPRAFGAVVSDEVDAAFAKALAVQPASRTPDVPTFWTELEQALGLPHTFVRRDDRQDPDDPPSWTSAPKWNDLAGAVARDAPPSPTPSLATAAAAAGAPRARPSRPPAMPSLEMPSAGGLTPVGGGRLDLEEPFEAVRTPAKPSMPAVLGTADDLEADLPTGEAQVAAPREQPSPPAPRAAEIPSPAVPVAAAKSAVAPAPATAAASDELELAPAPPPSRRSAPVRPAASGGDDDGRFAFDVARGQKREDLIAVSRPPPARIPSRRAQINEPPPPSLAWPVRLMVIGGVVSLAAVVGAQMNPMIHDVGPAPKLVGVAIFAAGLLLLFWRLFDR